MRFNNTTVALISKHRLPLCSRWNSSWIIKEDLPQDGERVEHRDGTIGVYTFDPDGNCVEFIWYNDECKKENSKK